MLCPRVRLSRVYSRRRVFAHTRPRRTRVWELRRATTEIKFDAQVFPARNFRARSVCATNGAKTKIRRVYVFRDARRAMMMPRREVVVGELEKARSHTAWDTSRHAIRCNLQGRTEVVDTGREKDGESFRIHGRGEGDTT